MGVNRFSRYRFCQVFLQTDGTMLLSDREPFGFRDYADNRRHVVAAGDTLWSLAGRYFRHEGVDRPSRYWWVIADFQPTPIFDPTLRLTPGTTIHIPSFRTLHTEILSEDRLIEHL